MYVVQQMGGPHSFARRVSSLPLDRRAVAGFKSLIAYQTHIMMFS